MVCPHGETKLARLAAIRRLRVPVWTCVLNNWELRPSAADIPDTDAFDRIAAKAALRHELERVDLALDPKGQLALSGLVPGPSPQL